MNNLNRTLIRESFDCSTYERERMVFTGKMVDYSFEEKSYSYAFKVENVIMRMKLVSNGDKVIITQTYPDASANIELHLNNSAKYELTLATGHKLCFVTQTSLIKVDDFEIKLKYNLIDETSKEVISFNEITIIGENDIC